MSQRSEKEKARRCGSSSLKVRSRMWAVVRVRMSRQMKNDLPPTLAHDRYSRWGCKNNSQPVGRAQYGE
jgi:hypothetical protein